MKGPHTCFVFDKLSNFFSVMDVAMIENKNTVGTWVGIGEGNLNFRLDVKTQGMLNWLSTTSSRKKLTNFSVVTEPSIISCVMILSSVMIGRIENLLPHMKHFLWTHHVPCWDQPLHLLDVLSSLLASSPNMNISGLGTSSAMWFMYIARSQSSRSRALPKMSLFVKWSWRRVRIRVDIDTLTPWCESSCSWISSRYTVCCWSSSARMNERSVVVRQWGHTPCWRAWGL